MISFQRPSGFHVFSGHSTQIASQAYSEAASFYAAHPGSESQFQAQSESQSQSQFQGQAPSPFQLQTLDFSDLAPFEGVSHQFEAQGLHVLGAITLQPSNPLFWTRHQSVMLMPIAGQRFIDLVFLKPIQQLWVTVMGVGSISMAATTQAGTCLRQHSPNQPRPLQQPHDLLDPLPPFLLEIKGDRLVRARVESSHPFVITTVGYAISTAQ
jgi:hypothetical protein